MPNTYEWDCEEAVISGLWKFSPAVTLEELQTVALEWMQKKHPVSEWEQLYIRGAGKDGALGIGFRYRMSGIRHPDRPHEIVKAPEKAREEFFHKFTDQLKRRFGNDFVGWDLSHPTWTLSIK